MEIGGWQSESSVSGTSVERIGCSVVLMTHTHTEKCGSGGVERIRSEEKVPTRAQGQGGEMRCVENVSRCGGCVDIRWM